jgi:hypothetical protein
MQIKDRSRHWSTPFEWRENRQRCRTGNATAFYTNAAQLNQPDIKKSWFFCETAFLICLSRGMEILAEQEADPTSGIA